MAFELGSRNMADVEKQDRRSPSPFGRVGPFQSTKGFESIVTDSPQPLRRNSSAMLSRNNSFQSAGKRMERFWRRKLRLRREHPVHPVVVVSNGGEQPATLPTANSTLPKRGQAVECSLDNVMLKLQPKRGRGKDFPEFDSLREYNVDDATALKLRGDEAARLTSAVRDPTQPVLLGRSGFLEAMEGDAMGYERLSRMSASISTALSLCLLDNECINVKYCTRLANRERLQKLVRQAQVASKMASAAERCELQEFLEDGNERLKAIFALINYISAVLARLVSQTASGPFWLTNVMAILAARVAKIKFLLVDVTTSSAVSASTGEDTLEESQNSAGFSATLEDEEEECEEALRILDANTKEGLTSEEEAAVGSYCINQNKYRSGINSALKYMLLSLRLMNRSGLPSTTYEMCAVVYEIGFEGFKTVLFQDRDLEYSASSDRGVLNTAHAAFVMLDQVLRELLEKQRLADAEGAAGAADSGQGPQTFVEWAYIEPPEAPSSPAGIDSIDYVGLSKSRQRVRLDSMADIVTVMVPLIASSPILLADFTSFRTMMALSGRAQDMVSPFQEGQFGAFCRLYTDQFNREAEKREILRLSKAFEEQRFSRCRLLTRGDGKWGSGFWNTHAEGTRKATHLVRERLHECSVDMQEWIVDETSVTISCRFYVSSVMMSAIILASGGIAVGFTVGERVDGVDPFNLATYTWVLAAFVILICKSILVEGWTWSDFLRQRVRCRSVSELAATTGVDEQLVMAKLLHDDCGGGSILRTRGPYNSVFRRQTTDGSDGFSIDRPISEGTLMLSGIALLKVVAPRGHAIVCLDYRRGTFLTVVEHQGGQEKAARLICDDLSRIPRDAKRLRAGWHGAAEPVRLRITKAEDFKWKRVQGLYEFKGADVVFE